MKYVFCNKVINVIVLSALCLIIFLNAFFGFGSVSGLGASAMLIADLFRMSFFYCVFFLAWTGYLTANYSMSGCGELCTKVYRFKAYGYVAAIFVIHMIACALIIASTLFIASQAKGTDGHFLLVVFKQAVMSYFLSGIFCILLGFAIGHVQNKKYLIVLFMLSAFCMSPVFVSDSFINTPLMAKISGNLNMTQCDIYGLNSWVVDVTYDYKWVKIAGFIALSLSFFLYKTLEKRIVPVVTLLAVFVICEYIYFYPHQNYWTYGFDLDYSEYYSDRSESLEKYDKTAPFEISEYDLDFNFGKTLKSRCKITIAGDLKDEYTFTLYHKLNVSKVTSNGRDVRFSRTGDYLTIYDVKSSVVEMEYEGIIDMYPVNAEVIYLPETFPFYPIAGKKQVVRSDSNVCDSFVYNDFKSKYIVKTNRNDVFNYYDDKEMQSGISLIAGCFGQKVIDGTTYVYPKYLMDPKIADRLNDTDTDLKDILSAYGLKKPGVCIVDSRFAIDKYSYYVSDDVMRISSFELSKMCKNLFEEYLEEYKKDAGNQ